MKKESRGLSTFAAAIGILLMAGVIVFVLQLIQGTKADAEVVFREGAMEITGQYGKTYNIADISEVRLYDTIGAIGRKVDGAGLGDIKKGIFEVEGMGSCRLFLHAAGGPYLVVGTDGGYVILNYKDVEKTKNIYEELIALTGFNEKRCDT
ncbi:MAG: hypothetical protein ACYCX2_02545 [Christensenellales bacterium]